jgi:hypothetical protein
MKVNIFGAPPRALEGARASEEPWSLRLISFTVNPPLGKRRGAENGGCPLYSEDENVDLVMCADDIDVLITDSDVCALKKMTEWLQS